MTTKTRPIAFGPEFNSLIVERNKIAVKVMEEIQIPVADYYGILAAKLDLAAGDRFHWTKPAYELLAWPHWAAKSMPERSFSTQNLRFLRLSGPILKPWPPTMGAFVPNSRNRG